MKHNDPNNPPFYVGQKVVRISEPSPGHPLKKGNVYVVNEIFFCCDCYGYRINVGHERPILELDTCRCCRKYVGREGYLSINFSPLPQIYEDVEIDSAIIEQAKDLIKVKETAAPVLKPIKN